MKKLLVVLLALAMLCAGAQASGIDAVLDYVQGTLALKPETAEQAFVNDALNLIVDGDQAFITWTDSERSLAYGLTGPADYMAEIYVQLVPLAAWDTCALYENEARVLVYDHTEGAPADSAASYDEYAASVAARFAPDEPTQAEEEGKDYVLNTNTKRFHYPHCPSVDQMKSKNRQYYHGTRDDLIASGYKPCGNCKP